MRRQNTAAERERSGSERRKILKRRPLRHERQKKIERGDVFLTVDHGVLPKRAVSAAKIMRPVVRDGEARLGEHAFQRKRLRVGAFGLDQCVRVAKTGAEDRPLRQSRAGRHANRALKFSGIYRCAHEGRLLSSNGSKK